MEHLLFATYLILFSWVVTKVSFLKKSGLSPAQLIILFLLKVMAGIFYGWLGVYYGNKLQMMDTWYFHYNSLKQYQLLLNHPLEFFTSLFYNPYNNGFSKFLISKDSWWNDVKFVFLDKFLALFNLFSFGNYYINVIFYSFITYFGSIALFRVLKDVLPNKDTVLKLALFFIPSFIFWNSGIHKDGLVFLSFALITYQFYFGLKQQKFSANRVIVIVLALALLILRSFVLLVLVPALIAWYVSYKSKQKPILAFGIVYALFITLFFTIQKFNPNINLMEAVSIRQTEFMNLHGNSSIKVKPLEPSFVGFVRNTPQAISLTLLRPNVGDVHHLFSLAACIETLVFILLFILFLLYRIKYDKPAHFLYFSFFLAVSMLLMIGYTVNILGAIVRYRSIVLPFCLTPLIVMTDWEKIRGNIYYYFK